MIMIIKMMVVMMIGYDNDVITMMMMMMKIKWSKHHKSPEYSPHTNQECEREKDSERAQAELCQSRCDEHVQPRVVLQSVSMH